MKVETPERLPCDAVSPTFDTAVPPCQLGADGAYIMNREHDTT